jgi:hypothetical protein
VDVAAVIVASTAAVTAVTAAYISLRREVRSVHKIVNQASTDAKAFNLKLSNTLRDHGIEVPVDDSVVPPKEKE